MVYEIIPIYLGRISSPKQIPQPTRVPFFHCSTWACKVASISNEEQFRTGLEQLVSPLVALMYFFQQLKKTHRNPRGCILGGGNSKIFLKFSPRTLGKWSNLTGMFFEMVWNHQLVFDWRQLLQRWSDFVNNSGPGNACLAKGPLSHLYMGVSENSGTPKSSILIGFSIIFTIQFGGNTPIFGNTHICWSTLLSHSILYPISILMVSFRHDILSKMSSLLHLIHSIYYWLVFCATGFSWAMESWATRNWIRQFRPHDEMCWSHSLPWEPTTFIFRGYNPYIGGSKPSFFMVLGSKGSWWFQATWKIGASQIGSSPQGSGEINMFELPPFLWELMQVIPKGYTMVNMIFCYIIYLFRYVYLYIYILWSDNMMKLLLYIYTYPYNIYPYKSYK